MNHQAVYMAHPELVSYNEDDGNYGRDKDGNKVALNLDLIAAKTAELEKLNYQQDRRREYPDVGTQLDYIYHNGIDKWKTDIVDPVKAKYPKPS
jgi:hypothetical protein|tara:strand:+ start:318 stop:599 length:282 start_codon:yes stop_codon:yes gene_type:complete